MTVIVPSSAEPLAIARELILRPGGLDDSRLDGALAQVMSSSVDAADLYFQVSREESWALEDGIVKEGSASIEQGVGVRALAGEKTGFAYSDEIVLPALEEASRAARAIASRGDQRSMQAVLPSNGHKLYLPVDPVSSFTSSEKVAWLERVDRETRKMDPRVMQVMASVVAVHEVILVANSEGHLAADVRPLVRFNVSVIVEQNGRREQGYAGSGGRITLPELVADDKPLQLAREAVRQALVNLEAIPAPAGPDDRGAGLRLAGHPAARGHRPRAGRRLQPQGHIGVRRPRWRTVASELCTIVDDGTLSRRRGSLNIDDEGTPTQCTTLIENGVLKGYLQDKMNARLTGTRPPAMAAANRSRTSRCRA